MNGGADGAAGGAPGADTAGLGRVAAYRPHAAVIFGSGLAALPRGAVIDEEIAFGDLEWACTAVPGHANRLQLVRVASPDRRRLRLALACGRPHAYEGWTPAELERPVRDLAAAGVARFLFTNSTGSLRAAVAAGDMVVCTTVVDLQRPPAAAEPPRLVVAGRDAGERVARALMSGEEAEKAGAATIHARVGTYVAVCGPHFETAAEVRWLGGYGEVVGMSGAPEARAARAAGAECCLLALVANRAAAVSSHDAVLAAGGHLARALGARLATVLAALWPALA